MIDRILGLFILVVLGRLKGTARSAATAGTEEQRGIATKESTPDAYLLSQALIYKVHVGNLERA